MYVTKQLAFLVRYCVSNNTPKQLHKSAVPIRKLHLSFLKLCNEKNETKDKKEVSVKLDFNSMKDKTRDSYLDMIRIFINRDVHRRGHVEFIYSALKNMEVYGVQKDLDVYKALIDVLPKGKFIPQNVFQAEFMHYPKQQQCAVDLLEQMEDNGVMPDAEMEQMLLNIFGKRGHPLRKYWRMMYWMPKFKNLSPWPVPNPPPNDAFDLAQIAIARICSVDLQSKVIVYQTAEIADAIEDTWIVSGQSPVQQRLLGEHNVKEPIYVEGPFRVWLRDKAVNYFILRANPKPIPKQQEDPDDVSNVKVPLFSFAPPKVAQLQHLSSVHEQEDGVILAVCATGTSSKDSLLSWIRHLEKDGNSVLAKVPIVFTLKTAEKEIAVSECVDDKSKIEDK